MFISVQSISFMANSEELKNAKEFETLVLDFLNEHSKLGFSKQKVDINGVSFEFDIVSRDSGIIGDVKFFKNIKVPAAKWDNISYYIWLLQKSRANIKVLIFGHDIEVSERYLKRYEPLAQDVEFYFFENNTIKPIGDQKDHKLLSALTL